MSRTGSRFDFSEQTVVVTGGSRGIGREICEAFAEAGARVHACGRRPLETPFEHEGISFESVDVRDAEATETWLGRCASATGGFDVLVNNAGGAPSVASAEASPNLTKKILELNLTAPLILSQQAHPHLLARDRGGVIVNIVS
ncbi:MAG TPA: SDR family NAD(P)-dependent oxidoreductase, partial [Deltaproteobacteria bacterium]|nr:SDR family NAD(P)-dependent oxidoreductase [Deltaproteobacteria bacterium]